MHLNGLNMWPQVEKIINYVKHVKAALLSVDFTWMQGSSQFTKWLWSYLTVVKLSAEAGLYISTNWQTETFSLIMLPDHFEVQWLNVTAPQTWSAVSFVKQTWLKYDVLPNLIFNLNPNKTLLRVFIYSCVILINRTLAHLTKVSWE